MPYLLEKMVFGDPHAVESQLLCFENLAGGALVNGLVRIGLGLRVRVRGEENADLHGRRAFRDPACSRGPTLAGWRGCCTGPAQARPGLPDGWQSG